MISSVCLDSLIDIPIILIFSLWFDFKTILENLEQLEGVRSVVLCLRKLFEEMLRKNFKMSMNI